MPLMSETAPMLRFSETRKRAQERPEQAFLMLPTYLIGAPYFLTVAAFEEGNPLKGLVGYLAAVGGTTTGLVERILDDIDRGVSHRDA
jgi:hypothetical protein